MASYYGNVIRCLSKYSSEEFNIFNECKSTKFSHMKLKSP